MEKLKTLRIFFFQNIIKIVLGVKVLSLQYEFVFKTIFVSSLCLCGRCIFLSFFSIFSLHI